MGINARITVTYYDNIRQTEFTRYYNVGIHPIHDAAKRDVGGAMAHNAVKEECGHDSFKILDYTVTEIW